MSEITKAIKALCEEKGLAYDAVLATIEAALSAAYRKDFGNKQQNIKVQFDPESGAIEVWDVKTVVKDIEEEALEKAQEELASRREKAREEGREMTEEETADLPHFNSKTEIMLVAAKEIKKKAKVGEVLEIVLPLPGEFGRMAAQTAKQVIIQKIREVERGMVFDDFKKQEHQLVAGVVQRVEGTKVLVDLGKITGIMPTDQQAPNEFYRPGTRLKFFVVSVEMSMRGPEIILSRVHEGIVREVFRQEIPEVGDGTIEIKGIARDPGFRAKVAVSTSDESIDPIGSCIGQRGSRIKTIIEELNGEKIDVIQYSEDAKNYIGHAISPAKALDVKLNEKNKSAEVSVAPEQFSVAIGRNGQNVRLASELTGWKISVKEKGKVPAKEEEVTEANPQEDPEQAEKAKE